MKKLFAAASIAFLALGALAGGNAQADGMPSAAPFFALDMSTADDKPLALGSLRGKPLIVNFWARWCGPCRQEIPELAKVRAKYKARGVEVLGLGLEDKPEAVREFAKAYDMDYPVLLTKDKGIALMQALGNAKAGLPFTLAVDRQGRIVYRKLGGMQKADIEAAVEAALR